MASVSTAPRMSSLTPGLAPASQPIVYSSSSPAAPSTAMLINNGQYHNTSATSYPVAGTGVSTYPSSGTAAFGAAGSGVTYPSNAYQTSGSTPTTYPASTTYQTGSYHTGPSGTAYPAGTTTTTSYPSGTTTSYQGGTTTTSYPAATTTTTNAYQTGGTTTTTYPAATTTTTAAYPTYQTGGATTTYTTTGTTNYPGVTTTYNPSATPVTSYPGYTSSYTHQVYHPENTEFVSPPRSLRGGMRPLYDMHQVRTYEAAPVFHSAPLIGEAHETHLTREGDVSVAGKSVSVASEDGAHKKKHSSKNTQGKKRFCC
eukprot:Gregarina_sp_Pseudo_9__1451@NODE_1975_length_1224_cov_540_367089_g1829_i0_p1_GENE_NODE_1975_length_1224_cov_540_367089_g1829_i0NODE_1975_length_1224_cov_540_367089_g1829_i0_p1_ORF_typecomplete_len344_score69_30_NODE_1975_length_1224_cov_540_367089_g1829_i0951033